MGSVPEARIHRWAARLAQAGVDLALVTQAADLFYLTGTVQIGYLAVDPGGRSRYFVKRSLERALAASRVNVRPMPPLGALPRDLLAEGFAVPARLGLELDVIPAQLADRLGRLFPGAQVVDVGQSLREIRAVKEPAEIAAMRRAGEVWARGMTAAQEALAVGMDEWTLMTLIEGAMRQAGHQGVVPTRALNFTLHYGHTLSGPHGAIASPFNGATGGPGVHPSISQGAAHRAIAAGEPVLLDYVGACDGYLFDGTRTLWLKSLPDPLRRAHDVALSVYAQLLEAARPGVTPASLWRLGRERAERAGLLAHFQGHGPDRVSFLGHGVGIELDEWPVLAERFEQPLEAGMTLAVEPKFVFPGLGAVGVESTCRVGPRGLEPLAAVPAALVP